MSKRAKGWRKALRENAKFKPGQSVFWNGQVARVGSTFINGHRLRYALLVFNGKGDLVFHADEHELTKIASTGESASSIPPQDGQQHD
jgi:hypothetical protein